MHDEGNFTQMNIIILYNNETRTYTRTQLAHLVVGIGEAGVGEGSGCVRTVEDMAVIEDMVVIVTGPATGGRKVTSALTITIDQN